MRRQEGVWWYRTCESLHSHDLLRSLLVSIRHHKVWLWPRWDTPLAAVALPGADNLYSVNFSRDHPRHI